MATKRTNAAPAEPPAAHAVAEVPLDAVAWGRQPREEFADSALADLAASLAREGLLTPIRVRKTADGRYAGLCGERRFRAARRNGWKTITAVVVTGDLPEADALAQQLAENEYREALKPAERAAAYRRLMALRNWTGKQLASALGVSGAKVCQELRLLDLPADVRQDVDAGRVAASTAYEIAKAAPGDRPELVRKVKEDGATRAAVKGAVRAAHAARKRAGKTAPAPKRATAFRFESPQTGPYRFVATGNRIVVTGPKIGSADGLAEAARALVAALELALTSAGQKPGEMTPAERPPPPAAPAVALSPPPGTVPVGNSRSDSFLERKS